MKKFTLIFLALAQIAVANPPTPTEAAKKQCEQCGKAIALQTFLKTITGKSLEVAKDIHNKLINEYIEKNCAGSDAELEHAVAYCENQTFDTIPNFWSALAAGRATFDLDQEARFSASCAQAWNITANKLKALLQNQKSKSAIPEEQIKNK
jgi:hypothetical protein